MNFKVNFYDQFQGEWRIDEIVLPSDTFLHRKGDDKTIGYNRFVIAINRAISIKFLNGESVMFLGDVSVI